jgi:uncharacterized protein
VIRAVALVPGAAEGVVSRLTTPLSFWGGYDAATGRVMDRHHPDHGRSLAGTILIMDRGRGSSSGSSVLAEAIRLGTAPAAIVLGMRDAIIVTGAMVALELYGKACPILLVEDEHDRLLISGAYHLHISGDGAVAGITFRTARSLA